ncbi:hypothetical protein K493DRAFT_85712 [Basidiobolus meristosporus CBS 931.73]|uniref:Uncharacterized protein n=1 Tax=Basidiobolus meristosporus CBS 931.73 TaxID=1314790 RepID=A0A1Y1XHI9_9FUNG|nr:hypothetical protein K493DRAFT_85712 [Basidiobolus meristosporus CBS 931.73]|eukprot:ORX85215.1 hypothetical protein K493DRAFT_85712 [Basidiobolus meristosporus CBS 931.73]
MKLDIILLSTAMLIITAQCNAWCPPWKSGSSMYVCKSTGKAKCINVSSGNACINLTGGPFISGYSAGSHKCTIYSEVKCGGNSYIVDKAGYSRFPKAARSLKCPCV